MNRKKLLLFLIVTSLILFSIYIKKYEQIVNEGIVLIDERCVALDHIIAKKQDIGVRWIEESEYATDETIATYSADLKKLTKETIDFSGPWLEQAKAYVNGNGVQFFINEPTKQYFYAYLDKLNADYIGNKANLVYLENPTPDTYNISLTALKDMLDKDQILELKNKAANEHYDFRNRFLKLYEPKCQNPQPDLPIIPLEKANQTG